MTINSTFWFIYTSHVCIRSCISVFTQRCMQYKIRKCSCCSRSGVGDTASFARQSRSNENYYHPCKFEQYCVLYVKTHIWMKMCMNTYNTTDLYWGMYKEYHTFPRQRFPQVWEVVHTGIKFKIDGHRNFAIWQF